MRRSATPATTSIGNLEAAGSTIDSSDSYFEDTCFPGKMWQRLIDVQVLSDSDIWYSHWILVIAKYSERSWNAVRSHIPVILGPVPGAELRHTNKIPPSDFAANNSKLFVEHEATVDELNTGMMFLNSF